MRKWTIICLCLVVAGGAALFASGTLPFGHKSQEVSAEFPEKLNERIFVFQGDRDQRVRNMVYAEDGKTPLYAVTEYANGDTGRINYRPDFTASEILRYFSLSLTNGEKVLRTRFVIGADGRKVLELAEYDTNKNLILKGERQPDGKYGEWKYSAPDVLSRYRVLTQAAMILGGSAFNEYFILEEINYYPNSTAMKNRFVRTDTVVSERTTYLLSGSVESYIRKTGTLETGYILWPNGMRRVSFEKKSTSASSWSVEYGVFSQSFDQSGTMYDRRQFGYNYMKAMLDLPGLGEAVQNWRMLNTSLSGDAAFNQDNFILTEVVLNEFEGRKDFKVILDKDGKTPTEIHYWFMQGDVKINAYVTLRPDGTYAKVRLYNNSTYKGEETVYNGNEGGSFQMPTELLVAYPFELPISRPSSPSYLYHP